MGLRITKKGYLILGILLVLIVITSLIVGYFKSPFIHQLITQILKKDNAVAATTTPTPLSTTKAATTTSPNNDLEIKAQILEGILKNPEWRKNSLDINVSGGHVSVKGNLSSEAERQALDKFLHNIAGVSDINLSIEIKNSGTELNNSKEDVNARLAKEVEFALYKSDAFNLKSMEIIANNGEISLRGAVRSRAEKLLAERIAREVNEVKSINNQLEIKEEN